MEKTTRKNQNEKKRQEKRKLETQNGFCSIFVGFECHTAYENEMLEFCSKFGRSVSLLFFLHSPFISHVRDMCGVSVSDKNHTYTHTGRIQKLQESDTNGKQRKISKEKINSKRKGEKPQCDR